MPHTRSKLTLSYSTVRRTSSQPALRSQYITNALPSYNPRAPSRHSHRSVAKSLPPSYDDLMVRDSFSNDAQAGDAFDVSFTEHDRSPLHRATTSLSLQLCIGTSPKPPRCVFWPPSYLVVRRVFSLTSGKKTNMKSRYQTSSRARQNTKTASSLNASVRTSPRRLS